MNSAHGLVVLTLVVLASSSCEMISPLAPSKMTGAAVDFISPPPPPSKPVPPAFPPLQAGPNGAAIVAGNKTTFNASGGDGNYSWSAPGGSPSAGTGSSFTTIFHHGGRTEYVIVTSGDGQLKKCEIGVAEMPQKEGNWS